jgi:hypothetical protein
LDERWRVIPGWAHYEISDQGRCRSLDRDVDGKMGPRSGEVSKRHLIGRQLTPRIRPDGTPCFNLWRDNGYTQIPARRLVLIAFRSPQPRGMDAKNIDGDVTNNHLGNLTWAFSERARASNIRRLMGIR